MNVRIDSWAWLPRESLTHIQQAAVKAALTIYPKKVGDFPGDAPTPLKLYKETDTHIAVPRAYYTKYRKPEHQIEDATTLGRHDLWSGPLIFEGNLRPEQQRSVRTVVDAFKGGEYGGIVRAATGFGKTVVSCAIMAELGVPTLVVVHKEFLLNQWKERIAQFLPNTKIGIIQQDRCDFRGAGVMIGMIHSLVGSRDYGKDFWEWPGLVISDECFPAGTLIATAEGAAKPIETFQVGDAVLSAAGQDTVARTFRKEVPVEQLRLVELEDGSKFICTDNHPVLSATDGWIPAGKAWGHPLLTAAGCIDTMRSHGHKATKDTVALRDMWETRFSTEGQKILLPRLYGRGQEANGAVSSVRVVWDDASEAEAVPFLHEQLSREMASEADVFSILRDLRAHKGVASTEPIRRAGSILTHERTKSHAEGHSANDGFSRTEGDEASSSDTGREWEGTDRASTDVVGAVGSGLGSGVCGSDTATSYQPSIATIALQVGPSASELQSSRGSGRQESQDARGTEARPQEVRVAAVLRVVSVTLPQPADFEQLGWGSVGDTGSVAVYNLSVVRHPSYVLHDSKVLVHNCHRVGAETWSTVPTKFKAKWRLGVSATPRRKDGAEDVFFHHIGPIIFTSSEQRMMPKIRRVWTDWKMVQTDSLNPNLVSKNVLLKFLVANKARNTLIVTQLIQAVEAGRRPMVLSERLQHLDALEAQFKRDWALKNPDKPKPTTGFYVGGMKEDELDESAKATVVFATRQFAEEGLDIPVLDTLFLTIPMSDVEQAVGRILRPYEGKKEPVVVDFRDDKVNYCLKAGTYRDRLYTQKGWTSPATT